VAILKNTMSKKLYCYSFRDFVDRFEGVETLPEDSVAISICTPGSHVEYHKFTSADNVLNLDFDDIDNGAYGGELFDIEMAACVVDFVMRHADKHFYVHCAAGQSRSQAIVKFIYFYIDGQWELNPHNSDYSGANRHVYKKLLDAFSSRNPALFK
jgi:hypothetical protein